ncbi:hypothetical protein M3610_23335 [Neobacillus sp. MER 74]|uniref:hypothetical protein n=1 Tax=Neobacillus sp. MER 74 TaxID=2939566 RepID=UPI00203B2CFE|nr:hypothetical protein [Neobacillus sp. MER 74]MCM3118165.1 hypothetical protein [Neobacillus sp. MER 74]
MAEKIVDVTGRYSHELLEIKNKLQQLEDRRVYELSKAQMDGYLATNVTQLKKMIAGLIHKIEYGKGSVEDQFGEIFGSENK